MHRRVLVTSIRCFTGRTPTISASEYASRRAALLKLGEEEFGQNLASTPTAVIVKGAKKTRYARDVYYPFKQNTYFRYLSGCCVEGSYLVFDSKHAALFVPEVDDRRALWDGRRFTEAEIRELSGVNQVYGRRELESYVSKYLHDKKIILEADEFVHSQLLEVFGRRPMRRLTPLVDQLRLRKSPTEIAIMKEACRIGSEALNATMQHSVNVPNEAYIGGRIEYEFKTRGASGHGYPPVVAAGSRANVIHYVDADQDIRTNDVILVDAGCDYDGYISDISRSFPISGKFTDPQQTLYEALQAIHDDCLHFVDNVRPLKLNDLYFHMLGSMALHLKEAHIFNRALSDEEILGVCDDICPHHVSHYLGLEVHDTWSIPRTIELPTDVVITVEPGVYFRPSIPNIHREFHDIGMRIEDDVLLVDGGSDVLTKSCVREAEEIESLMSSTI